MGNAVDRAQQVKGPRAIRALGTDPGKVIPVEDEPGERFGEITRLPFLREVGFGKSDRSKVDAATVEILISHGQLRLEFLTQTAKETAGTTRHRELQLPTTRSREGIEDKLSVKFISECHERSSL